MKKKLNEIEIRRLRNFISLFFMFSPYDFVRFTEKKCLRKITRHFFFYYKKGGGHEEHTEKQLKTKIKITKIITL